MGLLAFNPVPTVRFPSYPPGPWASKGEMAQSEHTCLSVGDPVIAHRDRGRFPADEQAAGGGSNDLQISWNIRN